MLNSVTKKAVMGLLIYYPLFTAVLLVVAEPANSLERLKYNGPALHEHRALNIRLSEYYMQSDSMPESTAIHTQSFISQYHQKGASVNTAFIPNDLSIYNDLASFEVISTLSLTRDSFCL